MKANTLPKSNSYASSYDRQADGHQAKNTHNSLATQTSANNGYSYLSQSSADSTVASNDASYADEQANNLKNISHQTNYLSNNSANDVSCGYKKVAPTADSASLADNVILSDEEEMLLHYMHDNAEQSNAKQNNDSAIQSNSFEQKNLTAALPQASTNHESEANVASEKSKMAIQKNHNDQSTITTTTKVSERIFMTSLLKHTGIALAIIIPLAAFTAYAATPTQTINATTATKDQATKITIDPEAIMHESATEPTTVDSVDLDKYAGTWYEIGRLPMYFQRNCASDVTANYTEKTDGSGIIVTNKCLDKDGSQIVAEGLAKPADDTGSKLKVTFLPTWIRWLPVGRADYWVLARDADYQTALVGTPDKEYLWLLARSPNVTQQTYAKYRQIAQDQGYNLKEFTLTPHANQTVNLIP